MKVHSRVTTYAPQQCFLLFLRPRISKHPGNNNKLQWQSAARLVSMPKRDDLKYGVSTVN